VQYARRVLPVRLSAPEALARLCCWRIVRRPDRADQAPRSFGSAVVIPGGWFAAELAGRSLVLTCAHVCAAGAGRSAHAGAERPLALTPDEAAIDFDDGERSAGPLRVRRVVWESPRDELDAALLEVDELPAWSRDAAAKLSIHPARQASPDERITLRGYLMNQRAQRARADVRVVAVQSPYLHYDVETGRGLSGAPLFGSSGELLGLHRGESKVLPPELALASRHGVATAEILRAARQVLSTVG
jgi:Trypsin-like peptidase domain